MSIKTRFAFLLGVLLLAFLGAWFWLAQLQRREAEAAYADARDVREQVLTHLLDLGGRSFPQLAISFAQPKNWGNIAALSADDRQKMSADLAGNDVQALWLLEPDGTTPFAINSTAASPAALPLPAKELGALIAQGPSAHFFAIQGSELIELALQRIDGKNLTLLIARRWSDDRLRTLSRLTESEVSLAWPDQNPAASAGKVVAQKRLDDWRGHPLRILRAEQAETGLERILQTDARPVRVFIAFGLLTVIALGVALQTWVLRPLQQIGQSLVRNSPTPLGELPAEKSELGGLARLVETSFAQSEALKKSEDTLRRTLEERTRLGRDLHDGIIQSLYAAGMGLASIRLTLPADQTEVSTRLEQTRAILNEAIQDLRNFITGLEPEALKQKTFGQAVTSLLGTMQSARPLATTVEIDDRLASRLSLVQRVHALQVIREAVSNAVRHGQAESVSVILHEHEGAAEFEITDDGRGFDPNAATSVGFGMNNLFERARDLDGELILDSALGKGTRIKLIFDFPA
jgi:signal transduction histidine kinase